jgi:glycosyltransferase involved in cell wall biosynthesis
VGSLAEGVLEGETGFICRPDDPSDLAAKIDFFFRSELYQDIERTREKIIGYAHQRHSWEKVGEKTNEVYKRILGIA